MGMDVYGKDPTCEKGKYFRRNVWGWRPLAEYTIDVDPELASQCEYWGTNDGDGLDGDGSVQMANLMFTHLESGAAGAYVKARDTHIAGLPREECFLCDGTGIRSDERGVKYGQTERVIDKPEHPRFGEKGWCNGCDGRGDKPPRDASYYLDERDIRQWAEFLEKCGGFEIW